MQHARDRVRELTDRRRLLVPVEEVVQDVNRFLRGWAGYFRYGNSARHLALVRTHATGRLALLVAKRHRRARSYGWRAVVYRSRDRYGLIDLSGSVARRGPTGRGGRSRMPAVKDVGEPGAGEPHARFDEAAGGIRHQWPQGPTVLAPPADPTATLRLADARRTGESTSEHDERPAPYSLSST